MLIRIKGHADVSLHDGSPVTSASIIKELDGAESEDACANYVDAALADLGITGGTVRLSYSPADQCFLVSTEYSAPMKLEPPQLQHLARDTAGQWSDGIGEGCFAALCERLEVDITLGPLDADKDLHIEQIDDGTQPGPPRTAVATAAREGDVAAMRRHLDAGLDIEARLQRYTALHLAVIYGKVEAALELIARGADVRAHDPQGQDALTLAASSTWIADDAAARVARALLERGASPHGPEQADHAPLFLARLRKKNALAAVLTEFGAE
jgi:ankyrin repeat protein